jgi:gamma-glutamyltranspeptidase / glutathione hydrolase
MRRRDVLSSFPSAAVGIASALPASASVRPATSADDISPRNHIREVVSSGDRPVGQPFATRSAAYGINGAAASAHPLATMGALDILRRGGSAADAAITLNACLGVVEPCSCGIGGDLYALLWNPADGRVEGLASSGRSPIGLSLEEARRRTRGGVLPTFGAVTISVPGAVAGWWALHKRFGKLPWAELFAPAIEIAERGSIVPPVIAYWMAAGMAALERAGVEELDNARRLWTKAGHPIQAGDHFSNPDLARTYRLIAAGGEDAFYRGEIAEISERYFKRVGGWLRRQDFAQHRARWTVPSSTEYRGAQVFAIAENTQGIATLQMLNILERFDMKAAGFQSALSIHLQAEAKRLAFEDRARFYGDPEFARTPTDWLISKDYAAQRARLIRPNRISERVMPGEAPSHGDTTYLTVADDDGLMISMIQSNYMLFGSGLVPDGLGFMFQNRGQLFSFQDGHPNAYAPGKRPFQTIIPGFALRDGAPWLSFGVMGGDMQPQGQVQTIVNRVDHALDVQEAGDAPRWHHSGSSEAMGEDYGPKTPTGKLHLERGVPAATRQALAAMGWRIEDGFPNFGRYQAIEASHASGGRSYAAAADMRADGVALAF